ncbi:anti-sigma-F factor Fin [Pullulanibacillus camelliae]|uniref:Anti-sigma-F factor Fin n=1 Tax=Pullulanibacillus camelliae TaxID=1707096 RepID=A0A8J2YML1_9BACL|nr:anti-sigma-F factor Fin family protein [Pullulanibacillus camelliae]GGE54036.1 anti-sigma-F factor Fin [Pullulanibacillus camelliae]
MDVFYHCRYCGTQVGHIKNSMFDTSQLGFDMLNNQERAELIKYNEQGHINVSTICEDCQEALENNPELHQFDSFIQ